MDPEETVTDSDDQADEAVAAPDDDTQEGSDDSESGDSSSESQTDEADEQDAGAPQGEGEEELLSSEELEALKDNPKALRKALNRAYTQKTQALAEQRRFAEAFRTDPQGTLRRVAAALGMRVTAPESKEQVDEIHATLVDTFGEEIAGKFRPVMDKLIKQAVEAQVQPLRQAQEQVLSQAATTQSQTVLKAFGEKYPDWKKHEKAMLEHAKKIVPSGNGGMTEFEYLEILYHQATRKSSEAETTKKVVDRLTKGAKKTDKPTRGAPASKVASTSSGRVPTFEEAFEAAKRGELLE